MFEEFLGWTNILIGFAWFVKVFSLALTDRPKAVVVCSLFGALGAFVIHLVLASYYGSIERPLIWTFWNFSFVIVSAFAAFLIIGVRSITERSRSAWPHTQDNK